MKLSENTIEILKNFASLNQGLVVKKGNILTTLSTNQNIKATAMIEEEFEKDFAIYDLMKTLGILSLNKGNPEVVVENNHLVFKGLGGEATIRQRFSQPNLIFGYEKLDKKIAIDHFDVNIDLTEEIHSWILSVASILKCPNIVIKSNDGKTIQIFAEDVKGVTVDDAYVNIKGIATGKFKAVLKIENLKIIPGEYNIGISKDGISMFTHTKRKVVYWISLEKSSEF